MHKVVVVEVDQAEPLEVFELEEAEDERFDPVVFAEREHAVAGIVVVDWRDGRVYHLDKVQVGDDGRLWCHELNVVNMSP